MNTRPNIKSAVLFIFKSTYLLLAIALVICLLVIFIFWNVERSSNNIITSSTNQFRVTADAKRFVKPDSVNIILGATIKGKEVRDVQAKASDAVNKTTEEIKKLGVKDEEIKTSSYNITPDYDFTGGKQNLIGYISTITLTVKTKLLDKVSEIIDVSTKSGINSVSSLNFYIENVTKIQDQLKLEAIDNAKAKASDLAKSSGLTLGKLKNVEDGNSYNPYYYSPMLDSASDLGKSANSVLAPINLTVQPGESELSGSVTLVYQID